MSDANRKPLMDAAESETLCMRGNSMHGNRETLETPAPQDAGRSGKASSALSQLNFGIDRLEFASGIVNFHLPIDTALGTVDVV